MVNLLLAAAGGVLHFLGFVGFGIWPLALICLVPLWLAIESAPGLRAAALLGLVFGWVSYAGGFLWMWRIVDVFLGGDVWLGAAVWSLDATWFALRYALYALLYGLLRRRRWPIALAGVPTLVVVEWLYPMLFPVYFGHALAERLTLIQISDLGGPLLLTALAALLNAAACAAWTWWRGGPRSLATWAAAGAALVLACGYGRWRMADIDRVAAGAPTMRVGVVQGNLGVQEKGADARRDHRRYLEQTRALLAAGDVDLVVWPETVYARGLRGPLPISGDLIREELSAPLLFGAAFVGTDDSGQRQVYNAALLVDRDGVIRTGYEKNLLIPFTEYVPLAGLVPGLAARFASASHFAAAETTPALAVGTWRIATPICYEAVRPAFVRRMVREGGANLLVSLANDAWFGDSQEPALHLAMARLRAVEQRRFLVRATNSGISAVIDANGRLVAGSGLQTAENLRATVAQLDETTWYARGGDWVGWLSAAVLAVLLVRRPWSS
ncbi:MAG TPA: apolipoprotein N-acyltransferase [Candidatus Dormibacteraeota bacterium]|nr:apolipoprotein N-acyltransferase [Candidatus Dormibacteraeota bacterium]